MPPPVRREQHAQFVRWGKEQFGADRPFGHPAQRFLAIDVLDKAVAVVEITAYPQCEIAGDRQIGGRSRM